MEDMVNKPPHYADLFTTKPTQCRAIAHMLGFDPGNVVKYVWRAGTKAPEKTVEDLQKAVNYLKDWQELYDILWEKDIGNYEAARAIFAQLEEPDDPEDGGYSDFAFAGGGNVAALYVYAFGGAVFLLLADLLSRTVLSPREIPIGVVTSFVGSIVFVWIYYRARKRGE